MMNVERLLGSLLKQGLRSSSRRGRRRRRSSSLGRVAGGLGGATLGMGALGVAIAAFEHFTQKNSAQATPGRPQGSVSPPSPPSAHATPPPPPPGSPSSQAELLVQAMVAAAQADGMIDAEELKSIRRRMAESGVSEEERSYLEEQLSSPPGLEDILRQAGNDPRLAAQIYAVSLAAIELDSEEERLYLRKLRTGLGIPEEVIEQIHQDFEIDD